MDLNAVKHNLFGSYTTLINHHFLSHLQEFETDSNIMTADQGIQK